MRVLVVAVCPCGFVHVMLVGYLAQLQWVFLVHAMVEERKTVLKRVRRLLDKASTSNLLDTESFLRDRVCSSRTHVKNNHNPSGCSVASPCKVCGGKRPPHPEAEPWHLRQNFKGQQVAKSAICAPCVWSTRTQQCRTLWPHWQGFRDGTWPPKKGA